MSALFAGLSGHKYTADKITMEYPLDNGKTFEITMRQAGGQNQDFERVYAAKTKPVARAIENNTIDREERLKIMSEIFTDTVIVGWAGLQDPDGNEIPFNRENCLALLQQFEPLFDAIFADASDKKNFVGSGNDEAVGNSGKPSSGD